MAGVPVTVQPAFLLTAALLGWNRSPSLVVVWVAVVLVSVLVHELGHAIAFRRFGIPSAIELTGFGGVTRPTAAGDMDAARRVAVSLAGPAAGLALGAVVMGLSRVLSPAAGSVADQVVADLVFACVVWSLANLLPIPPLDGGQVARTLAHAVAREKGETVSQAISLVAAAAVVVWSISQGLLITAALVAYVWWAGASAYRQQRAVAGDGPLQAELERCSGALRAGDHEEAIAAARHVLEASRSRPVTDMAAQLLIWCGLESRRPEVAQEGLRRRPRGSPRNPLLEGLVTLTSGRPAAAIQLLTDAFASRPDDLTGSWLVVALVRGGHVEDAVSLVTGPQRDRVGPHTRRALVRELRAAGLMERAAELEAAACAGGSEQGPLRPAHASRSDPEVDVKEDERPDQHGEAR